MTRFETERLVLRAITLGDKSAIVQHVGSLHVAQWLTVVPHPYADSDADSFLNERVPFGSNDTYYFAIEVPDFNGLVGLVGLDRLDANTWELGYWLAPAVWGTGIVSEAADAVVSWAFGRPGIRRLYAGCHEANTASRRILLGLGFHLTGTKQVHAVAIDEARTSLMFSLEREDWHRPRITTPRLWLRSLREDDAAGFVDLINNWNIARTVARVPHPYSRKDFDQFLAFQNSKPHDTREPSFAIQLKGGPAHAIGMIGLHGLEVHGPDTARLGFWIGEPFWNQGLVSEATESLLAFAFDDLRLKEIVSGYAKENAASQRIHDKFGFEKYGEEKIRSVANTDSLPSNLVRLTKAQWEKRQ